jgi:hypothetical protein
MQRDAIGDPLQVFQFRESGQSVVPSRPARP